MASASRAAWLFALLASLLGPRLAAAWGSEGHSMILSAALDSLPAEAKRIYAGNRRLINRWMAEPDKHHAVPAASAAHWIDIERTSPEYVSRLRAAISRNIGLAEYADEEAREVAGLVDQELFGRRPLPWPDGEIDSLWRTLPPDISGFFSRYDRLAFLVGTLVYQPAAYVRALIRALDSGDRYRAARHAGYLAHYTADACVPFHTTANYRGQHSGNLIFSDRERGTVHARFEDGFLKERAKDLAAKLKDLRREPEEFNLDEVTLRVREAAAAAYRELSPLLEADRLACERADPRRRWKRYLSEAGPAFEPVALAQLAHASHLLASLMLTAHRSGVSDSGAGSGNMDNR